MIKRPITLSGIPIVTRDSFMGSYELDWEAKKGARVLDSREIFDRKDKYGRTALTYSNTKIVPFTLLGLYSYFRGYLVSQGENESGSPCGFSLGIGIREGRRDWREYIKEELGIKFNTLGVVGENGSSYARALYLAGFPTGLVHDKEKRKTKATRESLLPEYLTFPVENYDRLSSLSKITANSLIRLTIDSFCDTRVASEEPGVIRYSLLSQPTKDLTVKGGNQIISAMNVLYPELKLTEEENITDVKKDDHANGFRGRLAIFSYQLRRLNPDKQRNYFPIRLEPRNRPCFKIKEFHSR